MVRIHRNYVQEAWTPAHVTYAQKIVARLAVEVVTGELHPAERLAAHVGHEYGNPLRTAAMWLGAVGVDRVEVLGDLTQLLRLHGVQPIGLVQFALQEHALQLTDDSQLAENSAVDL